FYISSYNEVQKSETMPIIVPKLAGNIVWSVNLRVDDGCPIYPMDVLISSQHGAVPWLNESAWSPDLLILRRQRFAIRLDKSSTGARAMFDTVGGGLFYFTVISMEPEPSKLQKLGIKKTPCSYAVHFKPSGDVPITTPLLSLDTNVTVRILIGQVQFFRLALPEFAYSVELEIFDCTPKIHFAGLGLRNASESGCALFALVSAGSVADPRQLSARVTSTKRIFAGQLSPLSDANYLSLAANKVPVSVTVSVRLHRKCRPPSADLSLLATSASSNSETACELYSPSLQNYDIYGKTLIAPSSREAGGRILRIYSSIPTVIPFTIRGLFDSVRYLLIDIESKTNPVSLDFCLGRRLSLGLEEDAKFCEIRFQMRNHDNQLSRVMPHPPAGVWYLAIVNKLLNRAEITLTIRTTDCPSKCLNGGQCDKQSIASMTVRICRCYDGFAGDLCEARVPRSPDPLTSLLLLCLSNAAFLPTVALAFRRGLLVEALIYCAAMLASAFYHACDNNYVNQLCVFQFDTLGKLDFLGAFLSLWVTLLLLVDLTPQLKQLAQTAGSLFLMIGVLINRTSFVIIAVPLGVGFAALILSWTCRCYTSKRCYPPPRLILTSLLPGGCLALAGFAMFALLNTRSNYYLVHSGWHCCVAFAIFLFLIPLDRVRFLPRNRVDAASPFESGDAGAVRNCGIDRCFVLTSRGVGNGDQRAVGDGTSRDVEYSALPLLRAATASSSRNGDGVLGNGLSRRSNSAMSLRSSSSGEDEADATKAAEDVDGQQMAEVSRQLVGVRVGRRRSPGLQASAGDLSGGL
ncbi:hypothetical protein BOX15_Mlig009965g2, partial [Macrostomum lignano]